MHIIQIHITYYTVEYQYYWASAKNNLTIKPGFCWCNNDPMYHWWTSQTMNH